MSRLDDTLAALASMTPAHLRNEWQRVHKAPAPRISFDLLARGIAWQLQERALGGLSPSAARELKRLAATRAANAADTAAAGMVSAGPAVAGAANNGGADTVAMSASAARGMAPARGVVAPPPMNAAALRPGTTLMRTWGDRSWSVLVTETGLVFEGRHYDSLSKIAREITGAHWSGPRFFGLRAASVARDKDRAKARTQDARTGLTRASVRSASHA